jgi:glycosyltransferase involved in cell wall biosynthesis
VSSAAPSPTITIAIPFYRGLDYLAAAIASVFAQTHADWRLIVADNGGEPDTAELMKRFDDPRVRYVRNPTNLGMAGNFNRCLELAETDFVTLLHSDDELEPHYCARLLAAGTAHPEAVAVFCAAQIIDEQGRKAFSLPDYVKSWIIPGRSRTIEVAGEPGLVALMRGNFIMAPTLCFRRARLGAERFSGDWRMVLDLDLYVRLLVKGERLVGIPDQCYRYRRHAENATSQLTANLQRFDEEFRYYDLTARAASARGWQRAAVVAGRKTMVKLNVLYCIVRHVLRLEMQAAAGKARFLVRRTIPSA